MKEKITSLKGINSLRQPSRHFNFFIIACSAFMLLLSLLSACKKDDYEGELIGECPVVISTDPMDKAIDVTLSKTISVTFNTEMNAETINGTTLTIKNGTTLITGTIAAATDGKTFTFKPDAPLLPFVLYTGTVTMGAKDTFNTAMEANYTWSFTTIPVVTLSASPVAGGTTTGAGEFAQGSSVTVSAIANTGYTFTNWTDNGTVVSTSSSYQFTMAGNKALVANFSAVPAGNFAVNLSSNPAAGGTNTGSGSFPTGTMVTITGNANPGYTFVNWTESGVIVSTSSSYQFTLTSNRTFVANYKAIPASQFAVTLASSPTAGGTTDGEGSYASGTSVTIVATRNPAYTFVNWTDKTSGAIVSTSASYTFALTANRSFVANFLLNTYTLNVTAVNGSVVKTPNQPTYNHGAQVVLTATPAAGFVFSSWTGDATGTTNPLTVTMNSNKNITANFTAIVVPAPDFLGDAAMFGAFGGSAGITNQGINTEINNGAIGTTGVSTLITGFHDGLTGEEYIETPLNKGNVKGGIFTAPPPPGTAAKFLIATNGLAAATAAYNSISPASKPGGSDPGAGELGGLTLPPGVYKSAGSTFKITTGDLTLDAGNNANAVWIFQTAAGLTVGIAGPSGAKSVKLINGALAKNVYWHVGSAAVINAAGGGVMTGTIISTAGVTFSTAGNTVQTVLNGRALSLVAAVTMVNTTINVPQ